MAMCLIAEVPAGFYRARRVKSDRKPKARDGFIDTIFVDPVHRRKGLGTRMLDHAAKRLRALGAETLQIPVAIDDPGGLIFLESHDFKVTARVLERDITTFMNVPEDPMVIIDDDASTEVLDTGDTDNEELEAAKAPTGKSG